jgi:hypothetical protein
VTPKAYSSTCIVCDVESDVPCENIQVAPLYFACRTFKIKTIEVYGFSGFSFVRVPVLNYIAAKKIFPSVAGYSHPDWKWHLCGIT